MAALEIVLGCKKTAGPSSTAGSPQAYRPTKAEEGWSASAARPSAVESCATVGLMADVVLCLVHLKVQVGLEKEMRSFCGEHTFMTISWDVAL